MEEEKTHKKQLHHRVKEKIQENPWKSALLIAAAIIAIGLLTNYMSVTFGGASVGGGSILSANDAGSKAIDYINKNLLGAGSSATMVSIKDTSWGVYNMTMDIGGRTYESFITKDGKMLFPSAIDMSQSVPVTQTTAPVEFSPPKTDKPTVLFFVMSFCPYGQQAETGLEPMLRLMGDQVNWEPHYVIYANYGGGGPDYCMDSGKYCSMHGIQEVHEDVRQLCIFKYYTKTKWLDYVKALNAKCTSQDVDTCWESVASGLSIDASKIKTCQQNEASSLLASEVALNDEYGVQGSPMVFVNDVEYDGGRAPADYQAGVCKAFNSQPSACSESLGAGSGTAATAAGGCG